MPIVFSWQENAIYHCLKYLRCYFFRLHNCVLKRRQDNFFLFLVYKSLRAISGIFFLIFFQSIFRYGKCIPFELYLFAKALIFDILWYLNYFSLIFLMWPLQHLQSIYYHVSLKDLLFDFCLINKTHVCSPLIWFYFMTFLM